MPATPGSREAGAGGLMFYEFSFYFTRKAEAAALWWRRQHGELRKARSPLLPAAGVGGEGGHCSAGVWKVPWRPGHWIPGNLAPGEASPACAALSSSAVWSGPCHPHGHTLASASRGVYLPSEPSGRCRRVSRSLRLVLVLVVPCTLSPTWPCSVCPAPCPPVGHSEGTCPTVRPCAEPRPALSQQQPPITVPHPGPSLLSLVMDSPSEALRGRAGAGLGLG